MRNQLADWRLYGPRWPMVEEPKPRWERNAAIVKRRTWVNMAVCPCLQLNLSHTTKHHLFENKVWEIYIFVKKCIRSLLKLSLQLIMVVSIQHIFIYEYMYRERGREKEERQKERWAVRKSWYNNYVYCSTDVLSSWLTNYIFNHIINYIIKILLH